MSIVVKFVLGPGAVTPKKYSMDAACFDLAIPEDLTVPAHEVVVADFRIKFEPLDVQHYMMIYPRSSLLVKHGLSMPTSIIDPDYRGSVHVIVHNITNKDVHLKAGMRIAQIDMVKRVETKFTQVEKLHPTLRGTGGLGSTGE
jgi:dUTP pyrophosphatase